MLRLNSIINMKTTYREEKQNEFSSANKITNIQINDDEVYNLYPNML